MKTFWLAAFLLLSVYSFSQVAVSDSLLPPETVEVDDSTYFDFFSYTNFKLLNREKVFKKIYKKAKREKLLNGDTVYAYLTVDTTGELFGLNLFGADSAYTFLEKIFTKKAKFLPASSPRGPHVQSRPEIIILSRQFLLAGEEYQGLQYALYTPGKKINTFKKDYYLRIKVTDVFHNGSNHKVNVNEKVKIVNQQTPVIKLTDSVAVYFEFPHVVFRSENYFSCNYYFQEKKNGVWNTKCSTIYTAIKYYNTSFGIGEMSCFSFDDAQRLSVVADFFLGAEE